MLALQLVVTLSGLSLSQEKTFRQRLIVEAKQLALSY
jgi:hypothetical protein